MSRMNEYREQRSRILLLRSRISFSRRVIAPHLCELLHFTPYVSLLQTDTFRMQPPICVPKYVAIYSVGGKISPQTPNTSPHTTRSLRNLLVSGNECGRVFPAGVGPGSPSRDAANWLPSRFSLSVETRRRYGWLRMMVFPGARLFPSPNLVPFGRVAARERQGALSRRAW